MQGVGAGCGAGIERSGAAPRPTVFLRDTCTGTNGTALSSHTPEVGGPWTLDGNIQIQGNKAVYGGAGGDGAFAYAFAPTAASCYIQADRTGTGDAGLVTNATNRNSLWAGWCSGGSMILYEKSGGSFTNRGSVVYNPAVIKLPASGDTIEFWGDGVLKITYTVASRPYQSNTNSGLMFYITSNDTFDNIVAGP